MDYADIKNVTSLYTEVVPLYEKMFEYSNSTKNPYEVYEKHINYVIEHKVETSSLYTNISEYLKKSALDYLYKLEQLENERS